MKNSKAKKILTLTSVLLLVIMVFTLASCGKNEGGDGIPKIKGLTFEEQEELEYATEFEIYRYEGGYSYITINDGQKLLLVPEGKEAPDGLEDDVIVLQKPFDDIYLVATSAMSLIRSIDAVDSIAFVGIKSDEWYIPEAVAAMESGELKYAGKYNAPDYEMLLGEDCDLAIESTMIFHNPEVKEKMEELGMKVMVERSSYETHPLGRTEWIKLYGELLDKQDKAAEAFKAQSSIVKELENIENTGKTVAFFYVNSNGGVVTRKSEDYVAKMIEIAGGKYIFEELGDPETKTSTVNMEMEEFYASAKEADYIFYNSSIVAELNSVRELLDLSPVLEDFKAVKEGNVWCTGKNLFQETDSMGGVIEDMSKILACESGGGDELSLQYFKKLK